jgi:hypothetical protein
MNRESHENRESFDDTNHSPLPQITTLSTLIASLNETQLEIRDRGAEKWWAKKWKTWGLMALFFCPPFFCQLKCATDISVDVNVPFNVETFQGDQNVVEYWIPDARTMGITKSPSDAAILLKHQWRLWCLP